MAGERQPAAQGGWAVPAHGLEDGPGQEPPPAWATDDRVAAVVGLFLSVLVIAYPLYLLRGLFGHLLGFDRRSWLIVVLLLVPILTLLGCGVASVRMVDEVIGPDPLPPSAKGLLRYLAVVKGAMAVALGLLFPGGSRGCRGGSFSGGGASGGW